MAEVGYYHMVDYTLMSFGPSVSLLGKMNDGKLVPGAKVGIEANFLFFDAKIDVAYLYPCVYIHPAIGFSILGKIGLMFGYNICTNQSNSSGFSIGLYYHISPSRKHGLNKW